ncbi:MAG TPA: DNA/RNA nuclease SfsA [Lentisphaeria bacterium]|nr:DNA/RNA nuclease SfsA [Lentisphaeria bacterium]
MFFAEPLFTGHFLRRRLRFIMDARLDSGELVSAHCTNTGSMRSCFTPECRVALSRAANPARKLAYTWELSHSGAAWIGVNTHRANELAVEAVQSGRFPLLNGYAGLRREVPYGQNSRVDILLEDGERRCYVEVKNVSMLAEDGACCFPDAVTVRGLKHIRELQAMRAAGHRALMLFVVQRDDGAYFRPADEIDPAYGAALREAVAGGVEALVLQAELSPAAISLVRELPLRL